jgi:N6-adenosine-specific RNA methylase IME4
MKLEFHPLANLFPLIEGKEFDALVGDIRENGLHDQIDIYQGKILDGRNRYRAAEAAGIEIEPRNCRFFRPELYGDPLTYVFSKNLTRRHLDESQRAMVAGRLATMRQGERTDLSAEPSANLPKVNQPTAAKTLSISERTLRHARRVQDYGAPELVRAVERGYLAVSAAERATRLSQEVQRRIAAEAEAGNQNAARSVMKQESRRVREAELSTAQRALPNKRYGVIYADPEWRFEVYSRDTGMDRAADNHYPTSATDAICARPVQDIAADDCVLFLWATVPMLPDALKVMAAWAFTYKSHAMWRKDRIGTGYWFRNAHELLLVGTRGNIPAPAMGTQWESVIDAPVARHSQKPDQFYDLIEAYFPNIPKIELNARQARPGWDAWGLEAPTDAAGVVIEHDDDGVIPDEDAQVIAQPSNDHSAILNQIPESESDLEHPDHVGDGPAVVDASGAMAAGSDNLSDDGLDIPTFLRRPVPEVRP